MFLSKWKEVFGRVLGLFVAQQGGELVIEGDATLKGDLTRAQQTWETCIIRTSACGFPCKAKTLAADESR